MRKTFLKSLALAFAISLGSLPLTATAQTTGSIDKQSTTYSNDEIIAAGHTFFGKASRGIGDAVQYVFQSQGEPTAFIVGEEGAGAFVGGLRYGEGTIYYKSGITQRIYWQGPSVGFDFGGDDN